MAKPHNFIANLKEGFEAPAGAKNPSLWSSNTSDAFEIGRMYQAMGLPLPTEVYKSRGDSYRILAPWGKRIARITYGKDGSTTVKIERID